MIMKKLILLVLLSVVFAVSGFTTVSAHDKRTDDLVTRTMDVPKFDAVEASRAVTVVLSDEITDKIVIIADPDLIDQVRVFMRGNTLVATIDGRIRNIGSDRTTVTVPACANLRSLDAESAARITSNSVLTSDRIAIEASSAGRIDVGIEASVCSIDAESAAKVDCYVKASQCEVDCSSASVVKLKGSADKCSFDVSSASRLNAGDFAVTDCRVEASSVSHATINAVNVLNAETSSFSSIHNVGGSTKNTVSKSTGGSISND